MKRFLTTLLFLFSCLLLPAQILPKFSYQAVVRNGANELLSNDTLSVEVVFYNHTPDEPVYSEWHRVSTNQNGLISLMIGEGRNPVGSLLQVVWNDAFVRTTITMEGGYSVSDVKRVTAVPFAFFSERVSLQAIAEHLDTLNLVSADVLRDSLGSRPTRTELSDSLARYVTVAGLTDTLTRYATLTALRDSLVSRPTRTELSDSLARYVTVDVFAPSIQQILFEINELKSIKDGIDEFVVPRAPSNSFQLAHPPLQERKVMMFINGVCVSALSCTVVGNHMDYHPENNGYKELVEGDRIQIYYFYKQ